MIKKEWNQAASHTEFPRIGQFLYDPAELNIEIEHIKTKPDNHNRNIELAFQYLDELPEKKDDLKPRTRTGYKLE